MLSGTSLWVCVVACCSSFLSAFFMMRHLATGVKSQTWWYDPYYLRTRCVDELLYKQTWTGRKTISTFVILPCIWCISFKIPSRRIGRVAQLYQALFLPRQRTIGWSCWSL